MLSSVALLSLAGCGGGGGGGGGGDDSSGGNGNGVPPIAGDSVPSFILPIASLAISAGADHTCAIVAGKAWCWGSNTNDQLGDDSVTKSKVPVAVVQTPVDGATAAVLLASELSVISAGIDHTCAIVDGAGKCWGDNDDGQLGNGSTADSSIPVDVMGLTSQVTGISIGLRYSCAIHVGAAKCWGKNGNGQLG